ncbi:MAG: hypothetical protein NVS1B4_14210 [Gemmatimonadaceae bacterium]
MDPAARPLPDDAVDERRVVVLVARFSLRYDGPAAVEVVVRVTVCVCGARLLLACSTALTESNRAVARA